MSFEDNFKSANKFTDKKNLVKGERELCLSEIKEYINEDSEEYKLFTNLKLKELQKVTELISLCPKENRSNFMEYGIAKIIKSVRKITIEEWDKIIEIISLCPEENRYQFMTHGIVEIIKPGREITIEGWDKIIEIISLCPEGRHIKFIMVIAEIIKSKKEINIEKWDKTKKAISLCPEKNRSIFIFVIADIIISGREIIIEECEKIIELISLCPEKNHLHFVSVIAEIIKSGREIIIEECKKIIELISLCPEKNCLPFISVIAEIIKSKKEINIEKWDKMIYYIKYFEDHKAINFRNLENIWELIDEIDILNENKDDFNFEEILNKLNNKIFSRLEKRSNLQFRRSENIEKKMNRNLVIYIKRGMGEVEGIKTSAIIKLLNDYINSGRSPVFSNLIITSYIENISPHYIHELGVKEEQYKYDKGEDFQEIIADNKSNTIFLTHSNVKEVQYKRQIPIISQSVLQNRNNYYGTKGKDYIPLQIFMDQKDSNSPMNYEDFAKKDRSISLERTLIAMMFSLIHLENRLMEKKNT